MCFHPWTEALAPYLFVCLFVYCPPPKGPQNLASVMHIALGCLIAAHTFLPLHHLPRGDVHKPLRVCWPQSVCWKSTVCTEELNTALRVDRHEAPGYGCVGY